MRIGDHSSFDLDTAKGHIVDLQPAAYPYGWHGWEYMLCRIGVLKRGVKEATRPGERTWLTPDEIVQIRRGIR